MDNNLTFMDALGAIGNYKRVSCVVSGGNPVVYEVVGGELAINGKATDYRNFCFSPNQILFGTWTIEENNTNPGD